jgi:hypothetical protein
LERILSNEFITDVFFLYRKMKILQEFHGRESDKIWPEVKKYLDRVLNEPSARKHAA